MHRQVAGSLVVMVACAGCASSGIAARDWEMAFTTPGGQVVLTTLSSAELFNGDDLPRSRRVLRTIGRCEGAWSDPLSGRIATLERERHQDVVRVYDEISEPILEYESDQLLTGRARSLPALSAGGRRVAFVTEHGAVFVGRIDTGERDLVQVCDLAPSTGQWMARRDCMWRSRDGVVVGCGERIYEVDVARHQTDFIVFGQPAGVAAGAILLVRDGPNARFELIDATSGTALLALPGRFAGISPDGQFVALIARNEAGVEEFVVHHRNTARRRVVRFVEPGWRLGSWHDVTALHEVASAGRPSAHPWKVGSSEHNRRTP